jgi:hypothetical protein
LLATGVILLATGYIAGLREKEYVWLGILRMRWSGVPSGGRRYTHAMTKINGSLWGDEGTFLAAQSKGCSKTADDISGAVLVLPRVPIFVRRGE